jgi:hypothetical protein
MIVASYEHLNQQQKGKHIMYRKEITKQTFNTLIAGQTVAAVNVGADNTVYYYTPTPTDAVLKEVQHTAPYTATFYSLES